MATTPYPFVAGAVLTASQLNSTFNIPTTTKTASYTLTAADAGTRIYMNSASATTITVNTSIFSASDVVEIFNIGAGVTTITAGTATVSSAGPLAIPQYGSGRLTFTATGSSIYTPSAITASASGLVCVKAETAFSAVASVTADNVFSATYTNYILTLRYTTSTTNNLFLQFRAGGVTAATNYNQQFLVADNTTVSADRITGQTSAQIARSTNGDFKSLVTVQISGPYLAEPTLYAQQVANSGGAYTTPISQQPIGNHSTATSYDGFILSVSTGTFTGSYTVYGYSKTV